jgi:membrane protease YdiL (CAAX protease family)
MDREFKFALGFLVFLVAVSTALLEALAHIHPFSREFLSGFLPFLLLLGPYILFSVRSFTDLLRDAAYYSFWRKLHFPAYLLAAYVISTSFSGLFQWALFFKLAVWVYLPTFLLFKADAPLGWKDFAAVLVLWLPIEFGWLPGFDIFFNKDIQLPALAFAAPVLGLYLFVILRNYPNVGYSFSIRLRDLGTALAGLAVLAVLLIPLGTALGFIQAASFKTPPVKMIELLLGIYFMVAIPEELLFRGIIQNLLQRYIPGRFGPWIGLALAALIFGFSHYNNFSPPDWRYVWLATVAGLVYGAVYQITGRTTVSAMVHCGVNFIWAVVFYGTNG